MNPRISVSLNSRLQFRILAKECQSKSCETYSLTLSKLTVNLRRIRMGEALDFQSVGWYFRKWVDHLRYNLAKIMARYLRFIYALCVKPKYRMLKMQSYSKVGKTFKWSAYHFYQNLKIRSASRERSLECFLLTILFSFLSTYRSSWVGILPWSQQKTGFKPFKLSSRTQ